MSHYSSVAHHHGPSTHTIELYRKNRKKSILILLIAACMVALFGLIVLFFGAYDVTLSDMIDIITGESAGTPSVVILSLRLPRIITAIFVGWALAISGAVMQAVLRNPLSSPFTLGVSHGAAFGAAFAIVVLGAGTTGMSALRGTSNLVTVDSVYLITISAFLGALLTMAVVLFLASFKKLKSDAIILAGIALSSLFTSGTILLQYVATDVELAAIIFWSFGDVSRSAWNEIAITGVAALAGGVYLIRNSWDMNALAESDEVAHSLGINTGRTRFMIMAVASLLTAFAVAFNGVIAFLGLLAPHIGRRIVGDDMRLLVPLSGIIGSLLLLAADSAGRLIVPSGTLPVGVITSFMGAPLFIMLLMRRNG